jgi:Kef-type K+ transport system membrane component KefB
MEIGEVLLMLAVVFVLAKIASFVFKKFGIPGLVGEIIVGIILANVILTNGQTLADMLGIWYYIGEDGHMVTSEMFDILKVIGELGVIFLLFSVGLETRVKDLTSVGKAAILVATLGVILPFILGYCYIEYFEDGNMYHALFLGAAMVATSVGITARVIKDMKLADTKESRIIIGAAVIDDILGMIVLAIVSGMAKSGGIDIASVASVAIMAIVFVLAVMLVASKGVPALHKWWQHRTQRKFAENNNYIPPRYNMLVISLGTCLIFAWLAEYIGLAAIIGAFLAGMLFSDYAVELGLLEKVESINVLFVSFFFVYVGLQVSLDHITTQLIIATVIVIILAVIGKYVGCSIGAKLGDRELDKSSMNIIGIGMIPRGEVGIIVATIGLSIVVNGGTAISQELYTVVVLMSVITTIIAPPLLSIAFRKKYPPEYKIQPNDQL